MASTDSTDVRLVELEGASDPLPAPVPESVLKRREALRELYRQAAERPGGSSDPDSPPADSGRA